MLAYSHGAGGEEADHLIHKPNPALKYLGILLFVVVAFVIVTAVAWITKSTIMHHFGVDLFPMVSKK
jgi:energy-coupling factor transporter transmembrane protein EcfT